MAPLSPLKELRDARNMGMKSKASVGVPTRAYVLAGIFFAVCLGLALLHARPADAQTLNEGWSGYVKYTNTYDGAISMTNGVETGWTNKEETLFYSVDGTVRQPAEFDSLLGAKRWSQSAAYDFRYSEVATGETYVSCTREEWNGLESGTDGDFGLRIYKSDNSYEIHVDKVSSSTSTSISFNYPVTVTRSGCTDPHYEGTKTVYLGNSIDISSFDLGMALRAPDGMASTKLSGKKSFPTPSLDGTGSVGAETYEWHLTLLPDGDKDGFPNSRDNCPTVFNPDQNAAACKLVVMFTSEWTGGNNVTLDASDSYSPAGISSYKWDFGDGTTGTQGVVAKSYPHPGRYTVTLTVTSQDGSTDSVTHTVTVDPIQTYAPAVYLHPLEKYFPGDADAFLDNSWLLWDEPNFGDDSCIDGIFASGSDNPYPGGSVSLLSPYRMSGTEGSMPYEHYRTYGNADQGCADDPNDTVHSNDPPSSSDHPGASKIKPQDSGFVLDLKGTVAKGEDPRTNAPYVGGKNLYSLEYDPSHTQDPAYYEYVPGHYIVYWFFYPFNGWTYKIPFKKLIEYHEGDWEHIVVHLNDTDSASEVAYYQHYCKPKPGHSLLLWKDVHKTADTHPQVYSALGGHASFAGTSGSLDPPACTDPWHSGQKSLMPDRFSPLDKVGKGALWATWNYTVDATTEPWYGFGGNWGERLAFGTIKNYGPPGPNPTRSKTTEVVPSTWR